MSEFWRGRRVLLTRHTGFKGAWVALWLERMGVEVTGFALAPPEDRDCIYTCVAPWPSRTAFQRRPSPWPSGAETYNTLAKTPFC